MEALEILGGQIKPVEPFVFPVIADDIHDLKENPEVFGVNLVGPVLETEYFHTGQSRSPRHPKGILVEFSEFPEMDGAKILFHSPHHAFQRFPGKVEKGDDRLELPEKGILGTAM